VRTIIPRVPSTEALRIADECQKKDGSFPYVAMAERSYSISDPADRKRLIDRAVDALVNDTTPAGRAEAATFVGHAQVCGLIADEQLLRARAYISRMPTMTKEKPTGPATCAWSKPAPVSYADGTRVSNPAVKSMAPADLDRAVAAARAQAAPAEKVHALLAIAGGLVGSDR
jgi:hypothetical protein